MKKIIPLLLLFLLTDGVLSQFNREKIYDSPFFGIRSFYTGNVSSSGKKIIYIMLGTNYENPNESGKILRLNKSNVSWVVPSNGFLNPYWCFGAVPPNPPTYHCNYVREFKASRLDTGFVLKNSEVYCGGYESGNQFFVTYNSGIDTSIIHQFSQDMFGQPCIGFDINPANDSIICVCYIRPSSPGLAFVYKSTNRGFSWSTTDSMSTYVTPASFLKINPFNTSYVYITGSSNYVSTNSGYNFIQLSTPVFNGMYFDQTDYSIYALGLSDSSLYKSTNSGLNWTWLHTFSERPSGFEISPDNHSILYAGTRNGLYISINSGLNWSLYNNSFSPSKNVIGISKDPGTGESLYVCTTDAVYKVWGPYTGLINKSSSSIPTSFKLYQNYPNPFNPMTTLKIDVPPIHHNPPARSGGKGVSLKLIVYDMLGREVVTLINTDLLPGTYSVSWDASDYASGLYYYKLIMDEFVQTKKMVLIK